MASAIMFAAIVIAVDVVMYGFIYVIWGLCLRGFGVGGAASVAATALIGRVVYGQLILEAVALMVARAIDVHRFWWVVVALSVVCFPIAMLFQGVSWRHAIGYFQITGDAWKPGPALVVAVSVLCGWVAWRWFDAQK